MAVHRFCTNPSAITCQSPIQQVKWYCYRYLPHFVALLWYEIGLILWLCDQVTYITVSVSIFLVRVELFTAVNVIPCSLVVASLYPNFYLNLFSCFFSVAPQPVSDLGSLIVDVSKSYTIRHKPGRAVLNEWSARGRVRYLRNIQYMNIHILSEIRTRDPSNQVALDLRLRPHGHRDSLPQHPPLSVFCSHCSCVNWQNRSTHTASPLSLCFSVSSFRRLQLLVLRESFFCLDDGGRCLRGNVCVRLPNSTASYSERR